MGDALERVQATQGCGIEAQRLSTCLAKQLSPCCRPSLCQTADRRRSAICAARIAGTEDPDRAIGARTSHLRQSLMVCPVRMQPFQVFAATSVLLGCSSGADSELVVADRTAVFGAASSGAMEAVFEGRLVVDDQGAVITRTTGEALTGASD